ncbi:MAG: T9SS type A sorting domain-containing protein [Terrimonas sp.]|nr:T9SS type A sorting domain-containing protein [Terrimonas sp.]
MKQLLTAIVILFFIPASSQVLCGTANEGGSVTLTAPAGNIFTSIEFASYGTPNGSCGAFTIGGCHAANSQTICETVLVGQNSATVNATNAVFGDPCGGTPKRLYIQARYASTLPLTLFSFSARQFNPGTIQLYWESANQVNTAFFTVERSEDGSRFEEAGRINTTNNSAGQYSFTDHLLGIAEAFYYRLKIVEVGGTYRFSHVLRVVAGSKPKSLSVYPTLASDIITITGNKVQPAMIINSTGQLVKMVTLFDGYFTLNISDWLRGVYFIRTQEKVVKFVKN